jgi:hypothetical protein
MFLASEEGSVGYPTVFVEQAFGRATILLLPLLQPPLTYYFVLEARHVATGRFAYLPDLDIRLRRVTDPAQASTFHRRPLSEGLEDEDCLLPGGFSSLKQLPYNHRHVLKVDLRRRQWSIRDLDVGQERWMDMTAPFYHPEAGGGEPGEGVHTWHCPPMYSHVLPPPPEDGRPESLQLVLTLRSSGMTRGRQPEPLGGVQVGPRLHNYEARKIEVQSM